jgi:hypothetical protein
LAFAILNFCSDAPAADSFIDVVGAGNCASSPRLPTGYKVGSNLNRIDGKIPRDLLDGEAHIRERVERRALDWPTNPLDKRLLQQAIQLVPIA